MLQQMNLENMLHERSQTQKATLYDSIHMKWQNVDILCHIHRDRKYVCGCQWLGGDGRVRLFSGWWKCSGVKSWYWLHNSVNIPNTMKQYTLNVWMFEEMWIMWILIANFKILGRNACWIVAWLLRKILQFIKEWFPKDIWVKQYLNQRAESSDTWWRLREKKKERCVSLLAAGRAEEGGQTSKWKISPWQWISQVLHWCYSSFSQYLFALQGHHLFCPVATGQNPCSTWTWAISLLTPGHVWLLGHCMASPHSDVLRV